MIVCVGAVGGTPPDKLNFNLATSSTVVVVNKFNKLLPLAVNFVELQVELLLEAVSARR